MNMGAEELDRACNDNGDGGVCTWCGKLHEQPTLVLMRACERCGELIPPDWRHYQPPCRCTWEPTDQPPHDPDPNCPNCGGCGLSPCQPQDMTTLRVSGICATCRAPAYKLTHKDESTGSWGDVEGSARHYEPHPVVLASGPLVDVIGSFLEREHPTPVSDSPNMGEQ